MVRCCKGVRVNKEKEFETMMLVTERYSLDLDKSQKNASPQGKQVGEQCHLNDMQS